jgi:acyl-CoA synthetase (AMP-forming)/AMP-acid ligase II
MPISFIHDEAMAVVDHYRVTRDDILLHLLPVHHATGLGMMFFPFLIGENCHHKPCCLRAQSLASNSKRFLSYNAHNLDNEDLLFQTSTSCKL